MKRPCGLRIFRLSLLVMGIAAHVRATDVCGTYTTNQNWTAGPYIVTCPVTIAGAATPVLTVGPGVTVKFTSGAYISIGGGAAGKLVVSGNSSSHVTFTSNQASPTAGYWAGVRLDPQASATSSIAYADISYGTDALVVNMTGAPSISNVKVQYSSGKGVSIQSGSPTISAGNFLNNQWGMYITGGSPTISSATSITNNTAGGVWVAAPASPSFQTVTISNNTGYAISQDAGVTFGTMSALTVAGNTNNTVEIRNSTATTNTTWKNFGLVYVVTEVITVAGAATPVLTIEPGVTVKVNQWVPVIIGSYGAAGISAVGTAAQPIIFTANTASPTPGYWYGIQIGTGTTAASTIKYATVSYGNGIQITNASPTIDHVTLSSNNTAGISANASVPVIKNCNFSSNSAGFVNQTPATVVDLRLNWWNSTTGPSGSGPGTGQSVSAGALFEPWLLAAASSPQFYSALTLGNTTFNPNIGINANFNFTTAQSGKWTLTVKNGGGTAVRTLTGTGTTGTPSWDGKNDTGTLQGNAVYTYEAASVAGANSATLAKGRVTLDTTKTFVPSNVAVTPPFFSPNGDTVQDTTTLTAISSFDGATWTVNVKTSGGTIVRTATGPANPNLSYTWDGKNGSGTVQANGVYTLELTLNDGTASVVTSLTATLDNTAPVATISTPSGTILSNIYQSGSADVAVTGTSTDANYLGWALDYGSGASPSTWTSIAYGSTAVSGAQFATWSTINLVNGQFTLRLVSTDKAGNKATATRTLTLGNFNVTGGSQMLNPALSGVTTFTSIVPNLSPTNVSETLVIKNAAGATVKTLWSGVRAPGSYQDQWNGKNASNVFVPAGVYRAVATVTAGASNMTWDPPPTPATDATPIVFDQFNFDFGNPAAFWPFNNKPLDFTFTIGSWNPPVPLRLWLLLSPTPGDFWVHGWAKLSMCSKPGNFCAPAGVYRMPGTHTFKWTGLDNNRTLRTDITGAVILGIFEQTTGNVIQVAGNEPVISNLQVTPSFFRPGSGNIQISFGVGSFQNSSISGSVVIERMDLAGALKTISIPSQAPGAVSLQWNGASDAGVLLADGRYLLTATITDSLGSVTTGQTLIQIAY